jgi:hypothetical protein
MNHNLFINTFMNHLTNVYKHKCEQLQEQIKNITKMLNEAHPPRLPKRGIGPNIIIGGADNIEVTPSSINTFSQRVDDSMGRWFNGQGPEDYLTFLPNNMPQWMRENLIREYGRVIRQGDFYQRQMPDGTVQRWNGSSWININKPGVETYFGRIGSDGVAVPRQPSEWQYMDIMFGKPASGGSSSYIPRPGQPGSGTGNINPLANPGT